MKRVYKDVFPGIGTAEKDTKTAIMGVIKNFLKKKDAATKINLQAAIGLERKGVASESAQKKQARLQFFSNSGEMEINPHYLKYSNVVSDNLE